ncbi:MAG TPA: recombinase-like helix-turn-helix domain-containing protein [Pseudomonadota bacterium]|nr:recombinase-like helix-turn-helix domain-containing protein [Pseudomonadota bacterium]
MEAMMSEWRQPDWNVFLKPWRDTAPSHQGGVGTIEDYQTIRNIEWQSRFAPPTEYENHLADALEKLLGDGTHDLAGIVSQLNAMHVYAPSGRAWSEESFCAELKRLAA